MNMPNKLQSAIVKFCLFVAVVLLLIYFITKTAAAETYYSTNNYVRDYDLPNVVVEDDGNLYLTIPGTSIRNYDAPTYQTDNSGNVFEMESGIRKFDGETYQGIDQ